MSKPAANISQASLLELKAITAEHADKFAKEGKGAVRGAPRPKALDKAKEKDPFLRPSPGLVKRLAREARNDAKQRHFDASGPSDEQRRAILEAKARKYDQLARGDYSGLSERELAEATIDFDRKREEWSDHSSDEDESAAPARARWDDNGEDKFDTLGDLETVEYVDEMGRTRTGTRKEAREAEREKARDKRRREEGSDDEEGGRRFDLGAYAEVQQSQVIHGDQSFFPVYQPDPDAIKQKYLEAERAERTERYDASKEVRVRGAGAYQFSLDDEARKVQMAELNAQRNETERARAEAAGRTGSAAKEAQKRRVEERRRLVEAKRAKLLGGAEVVARLRREKVERDADSLLNDFESQLRSSPDKA
ncbi:putative protein [Vanrija pseudolonga]|uniref:Purtative protein n=1 Tax=Vanrija pseudolonga TaxID=143232 RepID=A0AAF1BKH5_9TREE|nr:purtative protein [Vanrija pseudolonga]